MFLQTLIAFSFEIPLQGFPKTVIQYCHDVNQTLH